MSKRWLARALTIGEYQMLSHVPLQITCCSYGKALQYQRILELWSYFSFTPFFFCEFCSCVLRALSKSECCSCVQSLQKSNESPICFGVNMPGLPLFEVFHILRCKGEIFILPGLLLKPHLLVGCMLHTLSGVFQLLKLLVWVGNCYCPIFCISL